MITFEGITKVFKGKEREVRALSDVSFEVAKGSFVSVVGKSGAGKTTLVKVTIGEYKPTQGKVFFNNVDITRLKSSDLQKMRRKIGVIFQDYKLLNHKTVTENLEYIMQILSASDESIERDVPKVLELVGLEDKGDHCPSELSGGEQQRLAIARALIHRPEVIIADEPTGNLDPYNTYEVINLLKKINELGTTVILFTHDKDVVDSLKRRVITLEEGKVIHDHKQGKFIL